MEKSMFVNILFIRIIGDSICVISHISYSCILLIYCWNRFRLEPVKRIIEQVLQSKLDKRKYNPKEAPQLVKDTCNEIQNQVKGK